MMEWRSPRAFASAITKSEGISARVRKSSASFVAVPGRGFFRKYPESNLLHKKMLRVSARIGSAPVRHDGSKTNDELLQARDLLLRAQCNDAYWHGYFWRNLCPHLRTDPWRNLIRAEAIADRRFPARSSRVSKLLDYDADGTNELLFTSLEAQSCS